MRDERFRRFRPFRDFARSRKAETALAARFFSRFRDFDGKSKSADGRIQGHPRRRLFGGLVNATPLTGARFFRDFEIPFSTKTESRNLRVQNFSYLTFITISLVHFEAHFDSTSSGCTRTYKSFFSVDTVC